MKDDKYKRNLQAWIEPELEARLVALILGEASDFEREELERLMEERPELAVFKRRLESIDGLVRESVKPEADEDWKLGSFDVHDLISAVQRPDPAVSANRNVVVGAQRSRPEQLRVERDPRHRTVQDDHQDRPIG